MTPSLSSAAAALLLLTAATSLLLLPASATTIGATYSASTAATYSLPPPSERIAASAACLGLSAVRLDAADPSLVRAFLYSNTSLLLTVPNSLVPPIAANRSNALRWLYSNVVPFHPRAAVSAISVGVDLMTSSPPEFAALLLPAIRNLHLSLLDLGIRHVSVSTTFSFVHVITSPFPPSAATFLDTPPLNGVIRPLLQHLRDTNSSFHVNLYPYFLYRLRSEIPIGFALFQDHPFSFRDDMATGARYRNLFDMMLDAVISAMAVAGHEDIPIVVTETGWPSSSGDPGEVEANPVYAELYIKGLLGHLKSGRGSPLRREGAEQVYIYEMMDKQVGRMGGRNWGILYANLTNKYKGVDYRSESDDRRRGFGVLKMVVGQLLVFAFLFRGSAALSLL